MTRKLVAVVDKTGKVLGTITKHGHDKEGRPMTYRLKPASDQTSHEIEVDDTLLTQSAEQVHAKVTEMLRSRQ